MLIILAVFCGLVEAIFTAMEVALGAVSRARLRTLQMVPPFDETSTAASERAARAAARVLELLDRPDRLTLLFISVTSFSLWIAASLLTWQALSSGWPLWVLPLAFVALLFGAEVIPLLIAARHAETIALRSAPLLGVAQKVCAPL
jgi:Mg2+/Co2+ transporter CorB